MESMLFNYETTGRTDFRDGEIRPIATTKYKEKPPCLRVRPPPLKDLHALTDWKTPKISFNLMHKPKDIVQTNPRKVQKMFKEPEDRLREHVQKTRPRMVVTPAIDLDGIDDNSVREMLVDYMYTTTLDKMNLNATIDPALNVRAPLSPVLAPANPITLQKLIPPYITPEWRMDSVTWDGRQQRAYCDHTKEFWLARTPKCEICQETAERTARRKTTQISKQH